MRFRFPSSGTFYFPLPISKHILSAQYRNTNLICLKLFVIFYWLYFFSLTSVSINFLFRFYILGPNLLFGRTSFKGEPPSRGSLYNYKEPMTVYREGGIKLTPVPIPYKSCKEIKAPLPCRRRLPRHSSALKK